MIVYLKPVARPSVCITTAPVQAVSTVGETHSRRGRIILLTPVARENLRISAGPPEYAQLEGTQHVNTHAHVHDRQHRNTVNIMM